MYISQIARINDHYMGRDREKVYVTLKDENGATYTRYEQYLFTPYNKQGKLEELQKGNTIDLKA